MTDHRTLAGQTVDGYYYLCPDPVTDTACVNAAYAYGEMRELVKIGGDG